MGEGEGEGEGGEGRRGGVSTVDEGVKSGGAQRGCRLLPFAHLALQASQLAAGAVQLLLQRRHRSLMLLGSGSSIALRCEPPSLEGLALHAPRPRLVLRRLGGGLGLQVDGRAGWGRGHASSPHLQWQKRRQQQ